MRTSQTSIPSTPYRWWWRLVKFGFHLLYNDMAWSYDAVAWMVSMGHWRAWQRTGLKYLDARPQERILEIAHGTGNLQFDLYAAGYERFAFDLSAAMGKIARRKLMRRYLSAPLIRARAQYLPFADQSFDGLIATFPTPFIFEHQTLAELYRILRTQRRLVIVLNGIFVGKGAIKNTLETAYKITGQRGGLPHDVINRFHEVGFKTQFFEEPCRGSIAQGIIAIRQE